MGLLSGLFKSKKPQKDDTGPMPSRGMTLPYETVAANGERLAMHFAEAVLKIEKKELDFSPGSLEFVDRLLQRTRDEGLTVNDFAETIFVAGCYVGEVLVRNAPGIWINETEAMLPEGIHMMPLIVKLRNDIVADPIAKAFKRFYNGNVDSLDHFYYVFANEV